MNAVGSPKIMSGPSIFVRGLRLAVLVFIALCGALPAQAQHAWERLPPTPTLPPPAHSGTVPVNGIRMWYAVYGHGPAVILVHGGMANANYWGLQIPALARGFQVIVVDSRGHGRSTRTAVPITYHLMASDVLFLMDALRIPQVALVGWSDGAIIGLDIAIHHPERLTRLFAFAANSDTSGVVDVGKNPVFEAYAHRTQDEYQKLSLAPSEFAAFHKQLDTMWGTEPHFTDAQLRSIKVPTWIVDGDHDELIKRQDTDRMAHLIPGARELILPGVSHFAFLQDPKQFNDALLRFLSGP
jgi:pimeloyl-ACP methyl ester carboxylesterase